ncbi:Beta antigen [Listeria innocua]|nr:Beta antigen [Listeria innocua]
MMTISQVKQTAKESLRGNWGIAIGIFVLAWLIETVGGGVLGWIPVVGWIALFLLTGPLYTGVAWVYLAISRREQPDVAYMFSGFKQFGRTFLAYLLISIFTFLWSLLLIVPGIIKTYSYSQTFFILRDNPNISALDAITESRHMMNGHKGRLFGLSLTFLLWYLIPLAVAIAGTVIVAGGMATTSYTADPAEVITALAAGATFGGLVLILASWLLTLGISLYVYPYLITSIAVFYDDLYAASEGTYTEETVIVEEEIDPFGTRETDPFVEDTHPEGFGPETKVEPETPEVPKAPETKVEPEAPVTPETTVEPETPEVPEAPETKEAPETPETPEAPEAPKDNNEPK